jgi:hypothetical protein
MGAKEACIQADVGNPLRNQARILPRRHGPCRSSPAGEKELAGPLGRLPEIVIYGLPGRLRQLKPDRPSGFLLSYGCPVDRISVRRNVLHLESDQITATQFAIDRQVEHRQVARSAIDL